MPSDNQKPAGDAASEDDVRRRLERRRERRLLRAERRIEQPPDGGSSVSGRNKHAPEGRRHARERHRRRSEGDDPERALSTAHSSAAKKVRPRNQGPEPDRIVVEFDPDAIDADAEKVVRRLTRAGHEAYLVGGCVRDLLVGHRPKDFDVATSARPEEVRSLFRNSRIIGRRFRLVHVVFPGNHVIETATFRRNPPPSTTAIDDDLLIRSDNVFGEAHEDALRRDFTINGLFYDVDHKVVLDWVGGMKDIQARRVSTIGDPVVRFQEDPVRMLRAVKFAARIDFGISDASYDAAVRCRGALAMAARPRLSEEILRLMRGGAAHRSIWLLWEMGLLDLLVPELSSYIADAEDDTVWNLLREVDRRTKKEGAPLDDLILWCALLLQPLDEACQDAPDRMRAAHDFLEPVVERLNLPRRASDSMQRIVANLPRVGQGRTARFKKSQLYPAAMEVLALRARAQGSREELELDDPADDQSRGRRGRSGRRRQR